jgi:3',5'-cyclic AMP phosphodiesterase CpdA
VPGTRQRRRDFYFVQLSDTHWGYQGPPTRTPRHAAQAVATVNALQTRARVHRLHRRPDAHHRRPCRAPPALAEFKSIVADLKVKTVRFMPGEHDASLDRGAAYKEFFGETSTPSITRACTSSRSTTSPTRARRSATNSSPGCVADLAKARQQAPIVVLTHRPLFDLAPKWDWATRDGAQAVELLMPFANVTVFYGHIHQEHHQMTGHIAHHSAKSLIFPLPAPARSPTARRCRGTRARRTRAWAFARSRPRPAGSALKVDRVPVVRA